MRPTEIVSCGIPGHDQPGIEVVAGTLTDNDATLPLGVSGHFGFAYPSAP